MPSMSDMFPSKYLSAGDLDDDGNVVTIAKVDQITLKNRETNRDEKKWEVTFREFEKGMLLNITNGKAISRLHGDDTDEWIGQEVVIYPTETSFGKDVVACIRVDEDATLKRIRDALKQAKQKPSATAKPAAKQQQTAPPMTQAEVDAETDDDIPF